MSASRPVPRPHGHARPTWLAVAVATARQVRSRWPRHLRPAYTLAALQVSIPPAASCSSATVLTLDVSSALRNSCTALLA